MDASSWVLLTFYTALILGVTRKVSMKRRDKRRADQFAERFKLSITQLMHKRSKHVYDQDGTEDLVGWRLAYLSLCEGQLWWRSMTRQYYFRTSAKSNCPLGLHQVPVDSSDCKCGFYSLKNPLDILREILYLNMSFASRKMACLLQVRVSGDDSGVIEGADGYRSAAQEVLSVWLPGCCSEKKCQRAAVYMAAPSRDGRFSILVPLCEPHMLARTPKLRFFTAADIRNQLPSEISWLDLNAKEVTSAVVAEPVTI